MTLAFLGDVMLGRLVNDFLKHAPPEYPWGNTLRILGQADARICNLECVISDRGEPWSVEHKAFHFRSDAKNVAVLKAAKIDAVTLANNHTLDFGPKALTDTLDNLDQAGIKRAGAGRHAAEARQPARFTVTGMNIALFAATDNEPAWEATDAPGTQYLPISIDDRRGRRLFERVTSAKQAGDLVIASLHWGPNWGDDPLPEHVAFGRSLVEAGADIVVGHSPHIVRGVELYRKKPILYSTGDFIDDYAVDEIQRNDESFIFMVDIEHGRLLRLRLYPTIIADFQARQAPPARTSTMIKMMQQRCAAFDTVTAWRPRQGYLEIIPEDE